MLAALALVAAAGSGGVLAEGPKGDPAEWKGDHNSDGHPDEGQPRELPDLRVEKTPDERTVDAGDPIAFTILTRNAGEGTAKGVRLSDPLPAGVAWSIDGQSDPGACSITGPVDGQELTCSYGELGEDASRTVVVGASTSFAACGDYDNTATVTAGNAPPQTDRGRISCRVPWSLTVGISGRGTVTGADALESPLSCSHETDPCTAAGFTFRTAPRTARLSATPATGFDFGGWAGCDRVDDASRCEVALEGTRTIEAAFEDVAPPVVGLTTAPPDGARVGGTIALGATASDNAGVREVELLVDGAVAQRDAAAPYGFVLDVTGRPEGSAVSVAVRATDTSGLQSTTPARSWTVENDVGARFVDPTPAPGTIARDPVTVHFTAPPGAAAIECRTRTSGSPAYVPCSSPYMADPVPDGAYSVDVKVTRPGGLQGIITRAFVRDTTGPLVSITSGPQEGQVIDPGTLPFAWALSDVADIASLQCALDDGPFGSCEGFAAIIGGLPAGPHTVRLRAVDRLGNETVIVRSFVVPGGGAAGTSSSSGSALARAAVNASFGRVGRRTRVLRISVSSLAPGVKVEVRCRGKRCTFKRRALRIRNGRALLGRIRRDLPAGTVLEVRVTKRGETGLVRRYTMRARRSPRAQTLCLPPGARAPRSCRAR